MTKETERDIEGIFYFKSTVQPVSLRFFFSSPRKEKQATLMKHNDNYCQK
jgi:hypothetical protein